MKQMEVLEGVGWSDTIERLHRFEEVTLELGKTMKPLMEAGLKKIRGLHICSFSVVDN